MTGGSVVATVDGRSAAGDKFDLGVANLAKLVLEIAYFMILKIELYIEVKKVNHLLRHQAHGTMNVNAAM